jgi:hypothetical protein
VSKTPDEWAARSAKVKRQLQVALGIWPMPTRAPLKPVVHGAVDMGDYTVERAYFESVPGFYVTGSLYRPKGKSGKLPGVLFAHGHWANGRFHDSGLDAVRNEIFNGGERFEDGGRSPLQSMCVGACRLGCVVFHYDMIGYADSTQLSFALGHSFAKQRPAMNTLENWGLYSTQAEANLQSIMGLQTINSIAALDFLSSLEDVDAKRIAVTGASGGGTQTFILGALDPRPAIDFPAVMVSTAMQGGCTCENCSLLRVGTGNIEFAALTSPRPLGMTGADDWTRELDTKGFPELQQHYANLGVPDLVMAKVLPQFGHNYNFVSREVMYHFFNKHLGLNLPEPIIEEDFQLSTIPEMTVWDDAHPRPPSGPDYERSLIKQMTEASDRQIAALTPSDAASFAKFREVVGGGVDVLIGRKLPPADSLEYEATTADDKPEYKLQNALIRNKAAGEELPVVILHPPTWNKRVVVWIHENGKNGLFASDGSLAPETKTLLASGSAVIGADLVYQGEFLTGSQPLTETRRVENPREFAGYTLGYNPALFAQRVHDVLTLVSFASTYAGEKPAVDLLGLGPMAGPWVAAARAQAGEAVARAAIDTGGFRFATSVNGIRDLQFLPGAAKYGDLPGILALSAPGTLWLADQGPMAPGLVSAAFTAAGAGGKLHTVDGQPAERAAAAIGWLAKP